MNIELIAFYVLAASALVSAILVVAGKNLVRSIFLFFVTLFSLAGLFVFSLADFVAITQIVIYVGGVLVLLLFAFLLSNKELLNNLQLLKVKTSSLHSLPAIFVSAVFLFIFVYAFATGNFDNLNWIKESVGSSNTLKPIDNTSHYIGIGIMTNYLLPFEMISVLLMMALIGAAHLARKDSKA